MYEWIDFSMSAGTTILWRKTDCGDDNTRKKGCPNYTLTRFMKQPLLASWHKNTASVGESQGEQGSDADSASTGIRPQLTGSET